jgi:hypothetical protein
MGVTAARETLDAALGQKVQGQAACPKNHARSAGKRTGKPGGIPRRCRDFNS